MSNRTVIVVYDEQCPFCSAYVKLLHLKEQHTVELVNARGEHAVLVEVDQQGLDLDEGMVVKLGEQWFHGADAMQRLALLSSDNGLLRRFSSWVFASPGRSRVLYPGLRAGRNAVLRLLGRQKVNNLGRRTG